jgi:hypothetical protein
VDALKGAFVNNYGDAYASIEKFAEEVAVVHRTERKFGRRVRVLPDRNGRLVTIPASVEAVLDQFWDEIEGRHSGVIPFSVSKSRLNDALHEVPLSEGLGKVDGSNPEGRQRRIDFASEPLGAHRLEWEKRMRNAAAFRLAA